MVVLYWRRSIKDPVSGQKKKPAQNPGLKYPHFIHPAPFWGEGTCDSSVLPLYLIPGYAMPSQPGRHSGGAKPLERLHFLSFEQEHVFDFEFWNTMLITFFLVISFTTWWLNGTIP
jgi:hypothetical protein